MLTQSEKSEILREKKVFWCFKSYSPDALMLEVPIGTIFSVAMPKEPEQRLMVCEAGENVNAFDICVIDSDRNVVPFEGTLTDQDFGIAESKARKGERVLVSLAKLKGE